MTASNRPDMTIEEIAERYQQALTDHAAKMQAIREAFSAFDPNDDSDAYVRAAVRNLAALAGYADKAAFSAQAWQGQLRPSLNLAFIRGNLSEAQCREFLPDWAPDARMRRDRERRAS